MQMKSLLMFPQRNLTVTTLQNLTSIRAADFVAILRDNSKFTRLETWQYYAGMYCHASATQLVNYLRELGL